MDSYHLSEKLSDDKVKELQSRLNKKIEQVTGSEDADEMMAVRITTTFDDDDDI